MGTFALLSHSLGAVQGDAVIVSLFLKHFLVNSDHFIIPCKPCGSWYRDADEAALQLSAVKTRGRELR